MICGFIEQEKVRLFQDHHGECDSRSLAAGQRLSSALCLVAGEAKTTEMTLNLPTLPTRPELAYHVVKRAIHRHLRHILPIVAWLNGSAQQQLSTRRRPLAHERAEKGRFSASVRTHKTDHIPALNGRGKIRDKNSSLDLHRYVTSDRDLIATSFRQVESQP